MASSYSTDLKLELMVTGENAGTWGDKTNTNLNLIQQAIAGYQAVSIAGGAQTTALTMDNAALSNARNAAIKFTGTITGNQIVTIPNGIEKVYILENGTTGVFTVQFKTVSGTGPTWATTDKGIKVVYSNGTDVIDVNANLSVSSFAQVNLLAQGELRLQDAAGGQYVGFKSPTTVTTNTIWTLPGADGTSGQVLSTNGSGVLSFATLTSDGTADWVSAIQSSNFSAAVNKAYWVDTTSAGVTVTLPASPAKGDEIIIVDYAGTFNTNNCTISPNGGKIIGSTFNRLLNANRSGARFVYVDTTQGWVMMQATAGTEDEAFKQPPYQVEWLGVAAGGGGGGTPAGGNTAGGGAGGYQSSFSTNPSGGGGATQPDFEFVPARYYTVTLGAGSQGSRENGTPGQGTDTVLKWSTSGNGPFTTILTLSGGGGGNGGANAPGGSGGSGGAGPTAGSGTANQGYAGFSSSQGGGGGAGAAATDGVGGVGLASAITGASVSRAGGGGGRGSAGGTGGGGPGPNNSNANGTPGDANTGGGGGGANPNNEIRTGGAGGSGVLILRYLTTNYSGTTTGSPSVTSDGTYTVITFNASGSVLS
jgi:hypothetical protein